jgi:imidazole glycerol-phosphate synthase subunit HisH
MKLAIIEYNAGNTCSVQYAIERLGVEAVITKDHEQIRSADKIIFPGVGSAGPAMRYLQQEGLDKLIPTLKQPVLGICLGMQLLCNSSAEDSVGCLGIVDANVLKLEGEQLPHVGWNQAVSKLEGSIMPEGNPYFYFVHSYYVPVGDYSIAETEYGTKFCSALKQNNFYGVQFHPEKSATEGSKLLENFIQL